MANDIEIALLIRDEVSAPLEEIGAKIKGLAATYISFEGLKKLIENVSEAQTVSAQLDAALRGVGATSGQTQQSLAELSESLARTTTASSTLVKQAESVLLTFSEIRGEAFERTIKVANDLAARMGVDLVTATRELGIALQHPGEGMRTLRAAGVDLITSQQKVLEELNATGRAAEAQSYILARLENNLSGAATAGPNTLANALKSLKKAFSDAFDGTTESTQSSVKAINDLTAALNDPKIKQGIDVMIEGLSKLGAVILNAASGVANFITGPVKGSIDDISHSIDTLQKKLDDLEVKRTRAGTVRTVAPDDQTVSLGRGTTLTVKQIRDSIEQLKQQRAALEQVAKGTAATSTTTATGTPTLPQVDFLREITPSVQNQDTMNALQKVYQEWDDQTKTAAEKIAQQWEDAFYDIRELAAKGIITGDEAEKRREDFMKSIGLTEFDLNEIKAKYEVLHQETSKLSATLVGIWQGVGQSIQQSLSDAIYNASFSLKSLVDIARRAFADITAALLTSDIQKLLKQAFDVGDSKDSSSGTVLGSLFNALFHNSGGGDSYGPTWVGEDGPELVTSKSGMHVYNQRQLAGGGNVNFAPQYNVAITGAKDDDALRQEFYSFVTRKTEQDKADIYRTLGKNGVRVRQ